MSPKQHTLRRRGFLTGCTAGMATLAGCSQPTPRLTDATLEHREPRRIRAQYPPVIAFAHDQNAVIVTGFMYYGSSSCDRITIHEQTYDRETDALTAHIVPGEQSSGWGWFSSKSCTSDMAGEYYRATFRFAGDLPARVTIIEDGAQSDPMRRTVTQQGQHQFCTTEHPTGSDDAKAAHWTCPETYIAANNSAGSEESG